MKLTTCLWFEHGNAREAANYYVETFPDSSIGNNWITPAETPGNEANTEVVVDFVMFGQDFIALNGGPIFTFNESISFQIPCKDQEEIDHYWNKLINDGGQESQCGWLKDKFGVSWQITSPQMEQYIGGQDHEGAARAVQAMLQMKKIVIADLKSAYENN